MSASEIEDEAMKLAPQDRARLAERLLESLENLTDEENAAIWAEEAKRRDGDWDQQSSRPAADVLGDARANLK